MGFSDAAGVKTAALLMAVGTALSRSGTEREGCAGNFGKIPGNWIKLYKFTGFFDKKRKRENIATYCNEKTCFIYLSAGGSDTAAKFSLRPAFARICDELRGSPRISAQTARRKARRRPGAGFLSAA